MMNVFLEGNGFMISKIAKRLSNRDQKQTAAKHGKSNIALAMGVAENIVSIKQLMDSPVDLITRTFKIGPNHHLCGIVCIDGLVDRVTINDQLLKNMLLSSTDDHIQLPDNADEVLTVLQMEVLSIDGIQEVDTMDDVMLAILDGDTALFIDG